MNTRTALAGLAALLGVEGVRADNAARPNNPAAKAATAPAAEAGDRFTGMMRQIGQPPDFPMVLRLTESGGETEYPTFRCAGRLTPIGEALGHRVFQETIVTGSVKERPSDGCIDGIVMVRRDGDTAVVGWFVAGDGEPVQASATLRREGGRSEGR